MTITDEAYAHEASVAATMKAQCKKAIAKTVQSEHADMPTRLAEEPLTAYNFMAKDMTLRSIEEIEMFARVRISNPGRGTEAKRAFQGSHTADNLLLPAECKNPFAYLGHAGSDDSNDHVHSICTSRVETLYFREEQGEP